MYVPMCLPLRIVVFSHEAKHNEPFSCIRKQSTSSMLSCCNSYSFGLNYAATPTDYISPEILFHTAVWKAQSKFGSKCFLLQILPHLRFIIMDTRAWKLHLYARWLIGCCIPSNYVAMSSRGCTVDWIAHRRYLSTTKQTKQYQFPVAL